MQYIWSHKVFVFLRLLHIIKGERWGDARLAVRAHARLHKASPVALNCAHSLIHSLSRGGIEREGGGVRTLRSSRGFREYTVQTQTRQSVLEPDEFLDSTSIWRGSRRKKGSSSDIGIRYVSRPLDARLAAGKTPLHMTVVFALCLLWS